MRKFPDIPPVWTAFAIGLIFLGDRVAPDLWFNFGNLWLAAGFAAVGFSLIVWSGTWFFRKGTPIHPHEKPQALLVAGPYKISRNPIYLGMVIIALGAVIFVGNPVGIVPVFGLIWVLKTRFILPEENALAEAFGQDAELYLSTTRRWF